MNNEQYLRMLQMQQMQQQMQAQQPQQGFNPLNPSAHQINTVRQSLGGGSNGSLLGTIGKSIGNMMQTAGVGMLRGNQHPQLRAMGASMTTPAEQEAENFKIMEFLQKAEEAKRLSDRHLYEFEQKKLEHKEDLEERKRHNTAQHSHWEKQGVRETAYDRKARAEEEKIAANDLKNSELQKTNPGAVYLDTLDKSQKTSDLKEQSEYLKGEDAAKNSMKILQKIKKLYEENEGLGSVSTYALSKNGEIPRLFPVSKKLRTAVSLLKTYTSQLKLHGAQGLGNKGNKLLDTWIAETKVGLNMTDDAANEIIDGMYEDARENYYGRKNVRRDKQKGIVDQSSRYRIPPMPNADGMVVLKDNNGELHEINIKDDEDVDQALRFGWTPYVPE